MKSKLYGLNLNPAIAALLLFLFIFSSPHRVIKKFSFRTVISTSGTESPKMDEMDAAMRFEIKRTKDPKTGTIPVERLLLARELQQKQFAHQRTSGTEGPVPGVNWAERGPDTVGGRTRALHYDLSDPTNRKVWAGGVGGGLWYTNDITAGTPVWTKVNDLFDNLAVTSIAQHPFTTNLMMFGTGEGWFNGDAIRGLGIWFSNNGGATWTHLASTNNSTFYNVQDLIFAPVGGGGPCTLSDPGWLATTRDGGVMKSINNGTSWTKVLGNAVGGGNMDAAADLEAVYYYVYATLGMRHSPGGGIYRSCNAGTDWEKIYQADISEERIEIAPGPSVNISWHMYALISGTDRKIAAIRKTDNADTVPASAVIWTPKNLPMWCDGGDSSNDFTREQAWYDLIAAVDPNNHELVYIGAVDLFKSTNSGNTWTQLSQWGSGCSQPYVHADVHNIVLTPSTIFPNPGNEWLIASDGGIVRTTNSLGSFTSRNKSYNVTQFYSCAIHPTNPNYFLAGSQDNGTQRFNTSGINTTKMVTGGDGGFCHIDRNNGNFQITSYVENNYFISTDGGNTFADRSFNAGGQFINPTDYDDNAEILYAGSFAGDYFIWNDPATTTTGTIVTVADFASGEVTHVSVSPLTANRVYFGLDNGSVVRVDNAHNTSPTSKVISTGGMHSGSVSCIAIDPGNEDHILVTYSNYGITSVWETRDASAVTPAWTNVEGNLPDMPVRWAMFDPRNSNWAILATEQGIWSTDGLPSPTWAATNTNFANTRVDMLQYRASDRLLCAATHGRGLFTTNIPAAVPVTLMDFNGKLSNNDVMLYWKTASEQNSKTFDVERSYTGNDFKPIGSAKAAGFSNSIKNYQYTDPDISQEINYYRLKQIDDDGKFVYSKIIVVKNPMLVKNRFRILGNPINDHIDIQWGAEYNGTAELLLVDMKGSIIVKWSGKINPGTRMRIQIPATLNKGIYSLQVSINGTRTVYNLSR